MPTKTVSSFEVLARPIAPGVPNVPYVQQGFFLQISNTAAAPVGVEVFYVDTPAFVASKGAIKLFANTIDNTGAISQYPTSDFLAPPVGFGVFTIPGNATFLFGVQYLLLPPPTPIVTPAGGGTPQDSLEARGLVTVTAAAGSSLVLLATTRQVFSNYNAAGALLDTAEGAYANPLVGGPLQTF